MTTDPADPNDDIPPTQPANVTAQDDGGFVIVDGDSFTDDVAPPSLIRYDVHVNGELRAVVVGETIGAEVESEYGVNEISVVAVDTADNGLEPGTITVIR